MKRTCFTAVATAIALGALTTVAWAQTKGGTTAGTVKMEATRPAPTPAPPPPQMTPEQMADMMKPATELQQISWLAKNFSCTGKMWDPMTAAETETRATIKGKWILDKHWISWDYKAAKTRTMPKWDAMGVMGIDPVTRKVTFGGVDSMGGWINLMGNPGDTIAFEGDSTMMNQKTKTRFTFARQDKGFTSTFETQMGASWKKLSEETCK